VGKIAKKTSEGVRFW